MVPSYFNGVPGMWTKYTTVSASAENNGIALRQLCTLALGAYVYLRCDKMQWQIKTSSCSTSVAFDQTPEDSCNPLKTPSSFALLSKSLQINKAGQVTEQPIHLLSGLLVMAAEELQGCNDNRLDPRA